MSEGTIKRLTDKGFGFISNSSGKDMFFHMSACEGVALLRSCAKVTRSPTTKETVRRAPRAENVRRV